MSLSITEIEAELYRLTTKAQQKDILLRLLGGLAVWIHCPNTRQAMEVREYKDLDFLTDKDGGQRLEKFFYEAGYLPNRQLNTLNGDRRQIYFHPQGELQVDIFIGAFEMCHRIAIGERLRLEPITVPLAELFLTKAQIVQINRKDVLDICCLLAEHEVGSSDQDMINLDQLCRYCSVDWGLFTTVTDNLQKTRSLLLMNELNFNPPAAQIIVERLNGILSALDSADKSLAWKIRAKIGRKMRWYEEVEEVQR